MTVDAVFRALADPTRRAVFERLAASEEASVNALTGAFAVSQPAISQHLKALREAGLVARRREGRRVYYRVSADGLRSLREWTRRFERFWEERLDELETVLEGMDDDA